MGSLDSLQLARTSVDAHQVTAGGAGECTNEAQLSNSARIGTFCSARCSEGPSEVRVIDRARMPCGLRKIDHWLRRRKAAISRNYPIMYVPFTSRTECFRCRPDEVAPQPYTVRGVRFRAHFARFREIQTRGSLMYKNNELRALISSLLKFFVWAPC